MKDGVFKGIKQHAFIEFNMFSLEQYIQILSKLQKEDEETNE